MLQALLLLLLGDDAAKPGLALGLLASGILLLSYIQRTLDVGEPHIPNGSLFACAPGGMFSLSMLAVSAALSRFINNLVTISYA